MFPTGLVADAGELYRQYHLAVYAYLRRLTGNPDWAEDLLQETFYRAIVHAASYRGEASPLSWLCTIGRNLCATQAKQRARADRQLTVSAEAPEGPSVGPEAVALRAEQRATIARTLDALPEQQRLALLLRDWDGLPYETIAEMLGLTLANAKVTIHRARARFREKYSQERRAADD